MGIFIWFTIRDILLILAGVYFATIDSNGWAALMFLFFLMIWIQSNKKGKL